MLRLPNELLSRIADFSQDEDLPSMRLSCKLLEQNTRKHFATAFITEITFPASLFGIRRLKEILANPKFGPCVERCMALVDRGPLFNQDKCEALLTEIFFRLSSNGHGFEFGIVYRPHPDDQDFKSCQQLIRRSQCFARLMVDAYPSKSPVQCFIFDLRNLSLKHHLTKVYLRDLTFKLSPPIHGFVFTDNRDVEVRMRDRDENLRGSSMFRLSFSQDRTCIKFDGVQRTNCLHLDMMYTSHIKEVHIVNCNISTLALPNFFRSVESPSWRLEIKNCQFTYRYGWTAENSRRFRKVLCASASASRLSSCLFSNLTNSTSGPIFEGDFEATGSTQIRYRINALKFLERDFDEPNSDDSD
ncbi:hypothetical protein KCU64_g9114, partial [Aureobasidium melanogenum]